MGGFSILGISTLLKTDGTEAFQKIKSETAEGGL
jgi:hypothetical protein